MIKIAALQVRHLALVTCPLAPSPRPMEFGWWQKDDEGRKHQVCVEIFGKNINWTRKYGHNSSWEPFASPPSEADWDKLISEAERRVPRRLFSQKQFEFILSQRPK